MQLAHQKFCLSFSYLRCAYCAIYKRKYLVMIRNPKCKRCRKHHPQSKWNDLSCFSVFFEDISKLIIKRKGKK